MADRIILNHELRATQRKCAIVWGSRLRGNDSL